MAANRSYRRSPVPRRRSSRLDAALTLALVLGASGCAEEHLTERTLVLRMPDATSCAPGSPLASLRLRALGDGPGEASSIVSITPDEPVRTLPSLSYPTEAVVAIAEAPGWRGIGWRLVGSAGNEITLLPPSRSCPIADPETRAPTGAALAVLADGSLVIAGGLDAEGRATARVLVLAPGAQLAESAAARLALPIAFGSATALDDGRVLVAGGAISASAPAYDQVEVFDPRVHTAREIEPLARPRREHAAIRLRDGRVALLGGRETGDGEALDTIEVVDPARGESATLAVRLHVPRIAPWVGLAEDGRVWIAGGAWRPEDAHVLERLDVERGTIERWDGLHELPPPLALATLEGDRLAWVGANEVHVVALHAEPPVAARAMAAPAVDTARAVGISGRVLVGGSEGNVRVAYLLDPGRGRVASRDASRVPLELVAMVDGSVVELGATGASLRREEAPTPYDEPPATLLFATDEAWWTLDPVGYERWDAPRFEVRGGELVALASGARADLRALRGRRFDLELDASGPIALRLAGDGDPITIDISDDALALGDCRVERALGSPARIAIEPGRVRLGARACSTAHEGPVGLAFVAREAGVAFRSVRIARR